MISISKENSNVIIYFGVYNLETLKCIDRILMFNDTYASRMYKFTHTYSLQFNSSETTFGWTFDHVIPPSNVLSERGYCMLSSIGEGYVTANIGEIDVSKRDKADRSAFQKYFLKMANDYYEYCTRLKFNGRKRIDRKLNIDEEIKFVSIVRDYFNDKPLPIDMVGHPLSPFDGPMIEYMTKEIRDSVDDLAKSKKLRRQLEEFIKNVNVLQK